SFNNEYALNAVLTQTLFSFKVGYAIQAARYLNKLTENTFEATRQQVVATVKTSFYQTLLLKKVWEVAQDAQSSAEENFQNQKLKFDSGRISEFELLQAEVRWQNSMPETIRARQQYQASLNNLKVLVGIPVSEEISLNGNLDRFPEVPSGTTLEDIKSVRPDFNALMWEKKLRQKNVSAMRSEFLPSLEGSLTYTYSAQSDEFKLEQENDNIIVGLSLNIPVFSGGSRIAGVKRANADVEKVSTRLAQAEDNIEVQLQNIQLQLQESRQRIEASHKAVESASRAFQIAETRAQNGLSTQVELKDSRVALDQAQVGYYGAIYDYLASYFSWEVATGRVSNTF
nr:TolC family protein [Calditrichia bacterium]